MTAPDTRELTEKLTPHEQAMVHLRERCRELHQQLGRDAMLRQGDPVETLFTFAKSLIADREYVIGWNAGFEFATSEKEALEKELAEARIEIDHQIDSIAIRDATIVALEQRLAARRASHAGGGDGN